MSERTAGRVWPMDLMQRVWHTRHRVVVSYEVLADQDDVDQMLRKSVADRIGQHFEVTVDPHDLLTEDDPRPVTNDLVRDFRWRPLAEVRIADDPGTRHHGIAGERVPVLLEDPFGGIVVPSQSASEHRGWMPMLTGPAVATLPATVTLCCRGWDQAGGVWVYSLAD